MSVPPIKKSSSAPPLRPPRLCGSLFDLMFTANLKIKSGFARWADSLPAFFRRKGAEESAKPAPAANVRPEPQTEGERALYQAMGWKGNAWEDP